MSQLGSFIWGTADILRGRYKRARTKILTLLRLLKEAHCEHGIFPIFLTPHRPTFRLSVKGIRAARTI